MENRIPPKLPEESYLSYITQNKNGPDSLTHRVIEFTKQIFLFLKDLTIWTFGHAPFASIHCRDTHAYWSAHNSDSRITYCFFAWVTGGEIKQVQKSNINPSVEFSDNDSDPYENNSAVSSNSSLSDTEIDASRNKGESTTSEENSLSAHEIDSEDEYKESGEPSVKLNHSNENAFELDDEFETKTHSREKSFAGLESISVEEEGDDGFAAAWDSGIANPNQHRNTSTKNPFLTQTGTKTTNSRQNITARNGSLNSITSTGYEPSGSEQSSEAEESDNDSVTSTQENPTLQPPITTLADLESGVVM